ITMVFATNSSPSVIVQKAFTSLDSFPLMAIPFFILAGVLMSTGGISKRLLNLASVLIGFITGGLAMVTVLASMFFEAISGYGRANSTKHSICNVWRCWNSINWFYVFSRNYSWNYSWIKFNVNIIFCC